MTIHNPLSVIGEWYRSRYSMPAECKIECANKNVLRMMRLLPYILAFGVIMSILSLVARERSDPRYFFRVLYYSFYILLSLIPLITFYFLRKKKGTLIAQNIICYLIITIAQYICLYQRTASSWTEGYIVWTIANLVVIALFCIQPVFFLGSLSIQFVVMVFYVRSNGQTQFFNLITLVIITALLVFIQWEKIIQDFRNVSALKNANVKSDELLHNIFPPRVVKDLREKGSSDPEHFDNVSVMFTDLIDFTHTSSSLAPEYLIGELSDLFCSFDYIIEKYGCTRIKTIGDSYMAVCGLPESDKDHSKKIVQCGIECLDYLKSRNEHSRIKWKMRVGVHSGSVVAGIVGSQKYLYDVFGDTVNIASRMEHSSEEMEVNVSQETYNLTKESFTYETRESQQVKGKGLMKMYFAHPNKV